VPDWGRDTRTGANIHVSKADREGVYVCPVCRIRLELRRGNELEYFAHWRGLEGTRACELFSPTGGGAPPIVVAPRATVVSVRPDTRVEDNVFEAGLLAELTDGRWTIALRLPVLQGDELGEHSLADLRPANVEVAVGQTTQRVSALELLSGDGCARVIVPPDVATYRTKPSGTWPTSIETSRWRTEIRGLDPKGTLFRLRRGDWTRLQTGSGVHLGESLLLVADASLRAPEGVLETCGHDIVGEQRTWRLWQLSLTERLAPWLSERGHTIVPKRWHVTSAVPPRSHTDRREPVYWVGDTVVLALEAPAPKARLDVTFMSGSNTYGTTVVTNEVARSAVAITSRVSGRVRFQASAARLDIVFEDRPTIEDTVQLLRQTARVQVWIGERCFEPWSTEPHQLKVDLRNPPPVRVELGGETVRASVTTWTHGRQRTFRSRSDREVAKIIEQNLATASRIEVDGENLGRVTFSPMTRASRGRDAYATRDRLEPYARCIRFLADTESGNHDRKAASAVALVQARLALSRSRRDGAP
jgi:hypothetical protein